jgi:hypothetical protein
MVEVGIAWQAGKKIVIYKDDSRSVLYGKDNPLVKGLANFETTKDIFSIPQLFLKLFDKDVVCQRKVTYPDLVDKIYQKGEKVANLCAKKNNIHDLCHGILEVCDSEKI